MDDRNSYQIDQSGTLTTPEMTRDYLRYRKAIFSVMAVYEYLAVQPVDYRHSSQVIAEVTGLHVRTTRRALAKLHDFGIVGHEQIFSDQGNFQGHDWYLTPGNPCPLKEAPHPKDIEYRNRRTLDGPPPDKPKHFLPTPIEIYQDLTKNFSHKKDFTIAELAYRWQTKESQIAPKVYEARRMNLMKSQTVQHARNGRFIGSLWRVIPQGTPEDTPDEPERKSSTSRKIILEEQQQSNISEVRAATVVVFSSDIETALASHPKGKAVDRSDISVCIRNFGKDYTLGLIYYVLARYSQGRSYPERVFRKGSTEKFYNALKYIPSEKSNQNRSLDNDTLCRTARALYLKIAPEKRGAGFMERLKDILRSYTVGQAETLVANINAGKYRNPGGALRTAAQLGNWELEDAEQKAAQEKEQQEKVQIHNTRYEAIKAEVDRKADQVARDEETLLREKFYGMTMDQRAVMIERVCRAAGADARGIKKQRQWRAMTDPFEESPTFRYQLGTIILPNKEKRA